MSVTSCNGQMDLLGLDTGFPWPPAITSSWTLLSPLQIPALLLGAVSLILGLKVFQTGLKCSQAAACP